MKVSLPGLFANIVDHSPRSMRDYYSFCLDEVLQHLRETIGGKHTLKEFAEHYCLTDALPKEPPMSEDDAAQFMDNGRNTGGR